MKIEEHMKALEEHDENLRLAIERGLSKNQRNIAYNASQASVELFSIYLHKLNLLSLGENLDHRIFKTQAVDERIPSNFPKRLEILSLMKFLEEKRKLLCYGKRHSDESEIREVVQVYNQLKKLIGDI